MLYFSTIYAFDHKEDRIEILQDRMEEAGVSCKVARCMDFLRVKTDSQTYRDVEYVMVDPSCSGSGQHWLLFYTLIMLKISWDGGGGRGDNFFKFRFPGRKVDSRYFWYAGVLKEASYGL